MYYEINVSLNGKHLFATAERSLSSYYEAQRLYNLFVKKFSIDEGYEINIRKYSLIAEAIKIK